MKNKKITICVALVIIFLTLGLDQWTKWAITHSLSLHEVQEIIAHFFSLTYVQNTGAGFSLFEGFGVLFFALLTLAALAVIVYAFFKTQDGRVQLCLSLICSGALGNLIDRLRFGYVRDFLSFRIFGWNFPVFNIADICITVGFGCLIACMIYDEIQEKRRWKSLS